MINKYINSNHLLTEFFIINIYIYIYTYIYIMYMININTQVNIKENKVHIKYVVFHAYPLFCMY